jgi:outer membrane receptor for ferrienterochelin and colicins
MKYNFKYVILFCFFLLGSISVMAQNNDVNSDSTSLEDLMNIQLDESQIRKNMDNTKVVSASKSKENIASAPGALSVITKQDIQSFGALTLVDVLNRVTSMYVIGSFARPQNLATVRGDLQTARASHVLILIDGRPCRESFYGGLDLAVYNAFPLESIERIEVIRGPGSVLYGTNAYSGVISIITKRELKNTTQMTGKGGSFRTENISAFQSINLNGLNINLNGQFLNQNGWDFTAFDQDSVQKTIKYGQQNVGLHMNASYKDFSFAGFFGNTSRNIFGSERTIWDSTSDYNKLNNYRAFADFGYKHKFSDRYNITANATYNGFGEKSIIASRPANFRSNDMLFEVTNFINPFKNFNIVVGGLANYITGVGKGQFFNSTLLYSDINWVKPYNDLRWAAYTQIDYTPVKYLKLIAGGQINKAPGVKANFVPRFGAIVNFTSDFGLKLLYGQAFKYAAQYERFLSIPSSRIYGDSTLRPELVTTYDAQIFLQKSSYQVTVGAFYSKQKDVVILTDHPQLVRAQQFANLGSLSFYGFELEGKYLPIQQIVITGSFTYQNNIDNKDRANNTAISNVMGKLGIAYTQNLFSVGIFNSYFSQPSANFQTDAQNNFNPLPLAFNLASVNATANINKIFRLKFRTQFQLNSYVNNLLNENVYSPEFSRKFINSIPAMGGRAVYIGLIVKI